MVNINDFRFQHVQLDWRVEFMVKFLIFLANWTESVAVFLDVLNSVIMRLTSEKQIHSTICVSDRLAVSTGRDFPGTPDCRLLGILLSVPFYSAKLESRFLFISP